MSRLAILFLMGAVPALAICLSLLGLETLHTNLLGWFLFLTGIVYAAGTVIVAHIRKERFWESSRSDDTVREEPGDRSFWFITLGMMTAFYLSPLEYLYFDAFLPGAAWMESCCVGLVVFGCVLFVLARRALGVNYSGHVSVKKGQELVQIGPYRVIRHPAYAGYLLIALGLALGYASLAGLVSILLVLLPAVVYRIHLEDRLLAEYFGAQFVEYARKTKRLIPGIW